MMQGAPTQDATGSTPQTTARIDHPAPQFTARTTHGVRSLADYAGKWLVFFSHPADFTPVCTSEFIAFEKSADRFRAQNCELLGLSVDSIYSHLAWLRSLEEKFGVAISFPIVEDLSMAIAEAYGMIDETSTSSATVRSVFFIDPGGVVRAIVHYPMTVGRSIDEIYRVVTALQAVAENELASPEGWTSGDPLLQLAPLTVEELNARLPLTEASRSDWYYAEASA